MKTASRPLPRSMPSSPDNTLVVSPTLVSRAEINQAIHAELQGKGVVGREEHRAQVLVPPPGPLPEGSYIGRHGTTPGDVLRYSRGSKETGIGKGEYARLRALMRQ